MNLEDVCHWLEVNKLTLNIQKTKGPGICSKYQNNRSHYEDSDTFRNERYS